jgi:hypothetical protein
MEPKESVSDQSRGFHIYLQGSLSLHEWPSDRLQLKIIYEGYRALHRGSCFSSILFWLVRNKRVQCSRDGRLKWLGSPSKSNGKPRAVFTGSKGTRVPHDSASGTSSAGGESSSGALGKAVTLAGQKLGGTSKTQPREGTSKGQKASLPTEGGDGLSGKGSYRCLPCKRTCSSQQQLQEHLNGQPHRSVLRKAEKKLKK